MGYYAAGIAYGILGVSAGLPGWLVVAMSIVIYSGAAQYAAIPLFVSGAGIIPLVLSTLFISLRHAFYTLALYDFLPKEKLKRFYATSALTDENYALLAIQPQASRENIFIRINFLCHFYWISASLIGVLLSSQVAELIPHLDFALPCLFAILAYEQYHRVQRKSAVLLAIIAFILAKVFLPNWLLLGAILFCTLIILLQRNEQLVERGHHG